MQSAVLPAPAWLRGGSRPFHIAVAVILGAVAGATAGWNLTCVLLATLALLHHGPLVTTIVAGAVACAAANVGANLTTAVGSFCCEKIGFGGLIESLGHGPVIALLGWHDYELIGSATLALVLSLPAAHAMARRCKKADDDAEPNAAPLLRPWGATAAAVCMFAALATVHVAAPQQVGKTLLKQISAVVGAPVTADRTQYDLLTGRLQLDGVRVRDLDEPGRVALRFDTVTAEVDAGLLLRGRLHAERIELVGLTYDADPHGFASPRLFRAEFPPQFGDGGAAEDARSQDPTQPLEATTFIRNAAELNARLAVLGRLITAIEGTADLEVGHAVAAQRLQAARRPTLEPRDPISGRTLPLVQIKKLHIVGLPSGWSLGEAARAELVNLTSRPATTPRGVQLAFDAPARRTQFIIDLHLSGTDRRHDLAVTCDSCSAVDVIDLRRAAAAGIETTAAPTLALRGRGSVGRDRFELALACDVVGFRPTTGAASFGKLDAAVWRAGIDRLGGLRLDASLAGRWSDPQLQIIPAAVVDQLKHQLRSVGEHGLVKAVEAGRMTPPPSATPVAAKSTPAPEAKTSATATSPVAAAMQVAVLAKKEPSPTVASPAAVQVAADAKITSSPTATPPVAAATIAIPSGTAPAVAVPAITAPTKAVASNATPPVAVPASTGPANTVTANTAAEKPAPTSPKPTATASAVAISAPPANPAIAPKPAEVKAAASTVTPATAHGELRQPASVLDPSSAPGHIIETIDGIDPYAAAIARTRPAVPAAPTPSVGTSTNIAAKNSVNNSTFKPAAVAALTPSAPASSSTAPSVPRPTTPKPEIRIAKPDYQDAVVIGDEPLPEFEQPIRKPSNNNWFGAGHPTSRVPQRATTTPQPQPEQTVAKPWFPRVRKFFEDDRSDEQEFLLPETLVENTPPPAVNPDAPDVPAFSEMEQRPPNTTPIPETAKTPWYGRMFR